ncbi:MAG TPA: NfeD family protein [Chloroflexota bacterium]
MPVPHQTAFTRIFRAAGLALVTFAYVAAVAQAQANHAVVVGHINGIINPVTAAYVDRVITEAEQANAPAIVLTVDSPGGIADSERDIKLRIERSNVPVLMHVPGGAADSLQTAETLQSAGVTSVATNVRDLLRQVDGTTVQVASGPVTLHTADAPIHAADMSTFESFLHTVTNPTIAYILLSMGCLGLVLELLHPGSIFPGVVGGICLVLALYALGTLPLNFTGVALVGLGLLLFALEPLLTTHGVLAVGGAVAFAFGSLMLINAPGAPFLRVSGFAIGAVTLVLVGFFGVLVTASLRARRRRAVTGHEGLVGAQGVVRRDIEPGRHGMVLVLGELWRATAGSSYLAQGEPVVVQRVEGLVLEVRRASGVVPARRPAAPAAAKSRAAGL